MPTTLLPSVAAAVGVLAALFLALFLLERGKNRRLAARTAPLEAELSALKTAPAVHELRIERYELLWFPTLTCSASARTIDSVKPGLPHCQKCVAALRLDGKEWSCAQCGQRRPESVADTVVIDSVSKEAVKQFLQRHPDFRSAV